MAYQYKGKQPVDEVFSTEENEHHARKLQRLDQAFMAGMGGLNNPLKSRLEQAGRLLDYGTSLRQVQRITKLNRLTIRRYFPGETRSLSRAEAA